MGKIFLLFTAGIILFSCNKDAGSPDIVTQWQLIEIYLDPGDGSGDFEPATMNKTMTFFADGTIESNMSFCVQTVNNPSTTATYNTTDKTITPDDCPGYDRPIQYSFQNRNLILAYPCIEACLEKYERLLIR